MGKEEKGREEGTKGSDVEGGKLDLVLKGEIVMRKTKILKGGSEMGR